MAGLPHHAADTYIGKLLAAGKKVAICDQDEPAKAGKLVRRKLTRILSPGTALAANQLEAARNRYLCALSLGRDGLHAAWIELSTGEFRVATAPRIEDLLPALASLDPAEILVAEGEHGTLEGRAARPDACPCPSRIRLGQDPDGASRVPLRGGGRLPRRSSGDRSPKSRGVRPRERPSGPRAGGRPGALRDGQPVREAGEPAQPARVPELADPPFGPGDAAQPGDLRLGARRPAGFFLLAAMDGTTTSAGSRLLERWLAAPGLEPGEIRRRHAIVGEFSAQPALLSRLTGELGGVRDIPRILGRLQNRLRNPRELCGGAGTPRWPACPRSGKPSRSWARSRPPSAAASTSSPGSVSSWRPPSRTSRPPTSRTGTSCGRATTVSWTAPASS